MKKVLTALCLLTIQFTQAQTSVSSLDSLTNVYQQQNYHGVLLVAKDGKVIFSKGYGYANFEKKIPNTAQTLFKTESIGKMFTAVAIMQLYDKRMIRLDQTVKELLPELPLKNADRITIHHLLTHTSGLGSPWDDSTWSHKKAHSKEELINVITKLPLQFEQPGERMEYSNSGYIVLQWIIEKVSGQPFTDYIQKNIFDKAGMKTIRALRDTVMPEQIGAQPYRIISSKRYISMNHFVGPDVSGAGGWAASVNDLYLFMMALQQNKLISSRGLQVLRTANSTRPDIPVAYTYGLETYKDRPLKGHVVYGHNGGGAGYNVDAFTDSTTGYTVVHFTNIFQDSRRQVFQLFRFLSDSSIAPINKSTAIMDKIEEVGLEQFARNANDYFKALNVNREPMIFIKTAEDFEAVKDDKSQMQWLALAETLQPKSIMVLMTYAEAVAKSGDKEKAKELYGKAKKVAEERGIKDLVGSIDEKLARL